MDIDLKQLREMMKAMKQLGVNELELESETQRIYMRRGPAAGEQPPATLVAPTMVPTVMSTPAAPISVPPPPPAPTGVEEALPKETEEGTYITSPFVGTFYRSPSPDAPPFVEAGQTIAPGQVLCIVEAMKLMNEIEAEISGKILEVLAENGKPVEFGDRLFKVGKS